MTSEPISQLPCKGPPGELFVLGCGEQTPHYGEDVIYSLSKADTARALNMPEADAKVRPARISQQTVPAA